MERENGRPGEEALEEIAERAREVAGDAAHDEQVARREAAAGPGEADRDYGFRFPDEIQAGDRVRAEDDARTFRRQEALAHGQVDAADTLRRNAEALRRSAEALQQTREAVESRARDVQDVAETAERLRHDTEQVREGVRQVPAPGADGGGGGDDGGTR